MQQRKLFFGMFVWFIVTVSYFNVTDTHAIELDDIQTELLDNFTAELNRNVGSVSDGCNNWADWTKETCWENTPYNVFYGDVVITANNGNGNGNGNSGGNNGKCDSRGNGNSGNSNCNGNGGNSGTSPPVTEINEPTSLHLVFVGLAMLVFVTGGSRRWYFLFWIMILWSIYWMSTLDDYVSPSFDEPQVISV